MRSDTLSGLDGDMLNPFGFFFPCALPLHMWSIVMFQTACRGFASAELLISFFCLCHLFLMLVSCLMTFRSLTLEYSSFFFFFFYVRSSPFVSS